MIPATQQPPYRRFQEGRAYTTGAIELPVEECHMISLRAAQYVHQNAPRGPNNSRLWIRATWRKGHVGLHIPGRARHMLYLNNGIRPFVMWSLAGRTIPIRQGDGAIAFRRAGAAGTPTAPGTRRIDERDARGRIAATSIRWRHPGVTAMHFLDEAISRAWFEWAHTKSPEDVIRLLAAVPRAGRFFQDLRRTL